MDEDDVNSIWAAAGKEKEKPPRWTAFAAGFIVGIILIILLGLVNMFCYWAFDWRVTF